MKAWAGVLAHRTIRMWSDNGFDGDMKNSTGLMSVNANKELSDYMNTRVGWVTPDGQMRCTINYDTSIMMFKNLTTPFKHVNQPNKSEASQLMKRLPTM